PPFGDEPRVLKGRRGGTDEFLGRGAAVPQSPWPAGLGGRPLDKCLVQRHADAVIGKSHAAVSEAVNSSPVLTPRKKKFSSPVGVALVKKRGNIGFRPRGGAPPHYARNLRQGPPRLLFLSCPRRPLSMPVAFLVLRACTLSPLVRLGWGAIFGPLVW